MMFLVFEASNPCGTSYRLGLGCNLLPLASMVALLSRLF
jgi:hypothetical protein